MVETKVSPEIWNQEVEKFKNACHELGRTIKGTELRKHFMGLKCRSWYPDNAPDCLSIKTYTDFIEYLGEDVFYKKRPSKDFVCDYIKSLHDKLGRNVKLSDLENSDVQRKDIEYYFGNINKMNKELGFSESGTFRGHVYSKEELILLLQNFVKENGFVPNMKFLDEHGKEYNMPNRKTYNNKFGSWKNVLHECGFDDEIKNQNYIIDKDGKYVLQHDNKDFLQNLILEYVDVNDTIPTLENLETYYGTSLSKYFGCYFGGWNNCLKELGFSLNSVQKYTDEELDSAFLGFVDEFGRVPSIRDFNNTGRPSFWCYQNRYGSWAETCIHYGFEPNCRKPHYYMDDGERCDSRFEYDISTWLKSKGITYDRDIPYVDFTNNYNGKMNCDYRFTLDNGQVWYVEMAGFIDTDDFTKLTSREEELYFFKLRYKKKLFRENNLNYKIFHPSDLKNHTMEELFDFLNIKKTA